MDSIKFKGCFGDEPKNIDISFLNGADGEYNLMIYSYLHGRLFKLNEFWVAFFLCDSSYTGADIYKPGA